MKQFIVVNGALLATIIPAAKIEIACNFLLVAALSSSNLAY